MESPDFFVVKTVDNRAAVATYTFDPMLFQFCVTIATLINFTQNSDLNKSVQEILPYKHNNGERHFLFNKPLLMVAVMGKYFQCATRLIFKSIWCSDFKHIESTTDHAKGIFMKRACVEEQNKSFIIGLFWIHILIF